MPLMSDAPHEKGTIQLNAARGKALWVAKEARACFVYDQATATRWAAFSDVMPSQEGTWRGRRP